MSNYIKKLNKDDLEELLHEVRYYYKHNDWRLGQTFFNILVILHEDIAEDIRGSEMDPYYNDRILSTLIDYITE